MIALALLLLHESAVSSSRIEVAGSEVRVAFTFSREDVAGLARDWKAEVPGYLASHFRIEGCDPGSASDPTEAGPLVKIERTYRSPQPLKRLKIRCDLFREHGGNPRHVAELPGGRTVVFDRDRLESELPVARAGMSLSWAALPALALAAGLYFASARSRGK